MTVRGRHWPEYIAEVVVKSALRFVFFPLTGRDGGSGRRRRGSITV